MIKRIILLLNLIAAACCLHAQQPDYTGVWRGKFYDNAGFGLSSDPYKFEVQIAQSGKGLVGVTYSYLSTIFYGKASHNGYIKADAGKIVIQETSLMELKSSNGQACLMTCNMRYSKVGNDEFLEGTYTAVDKDNGSACPGGYVKLKKVPTSDFYIEKDVKKKMDENLKKKLASNKPKTPAPKPPATKPVLKTTPKPVAPPKPPVTKPLVKAPVKTPVKPPEKIKPPQPPQKPVVKKITPPPPVKKDTSVAVIPPPVPVKKNPPPVVKKDPPPAPPVIKERVNEVVKTIRIPDTNEVSINLYDYGEVDGDIITVFLDGREVVSKQMLRTTPISITIKLNAMQPEHILTMVAENLGTIPPNTALMVVKTGKQRFEATIESTEQKNAVVKFVYKPD
jgi:hypothetical protein